MIELQYGRICEPIADGSGAIPTRTEQLKGHDMHACDELRL
jgi:hypothetical protein